MENIEISPKKPPLPQQESISKRTPSPVKQQSTLPVPTITQTKTATTENQKQPKTLTTSNGITVTFGVKNMDPVQNNQSGSSDLGTFFF